MSTFSRAASSGIAMKHLQVQESRLRKAELCMDHNYIVGKSSQRCSLDQQKYRCLEVHMGKLSGDAPREKCYPCLTSQEQHTFLGPTFHIACSLKWRMEEGQALQTCTHLHPCAEATMARLTPVLPAVPSVMSPPGFSRPSCRASCTIRRATRSFTLPPGFRNSALPRICVCVCVCVCAPAQDDGGCCSFCERELKWRPAQLCRTC